MYIQLTTRCNMLCPHCALACTAHGEDMQFSVFKKLFNSSWCENEDLLFSGGEPTIHTNFREMLDYAVLNVKSLRLKDRPKIRVCTNGANTSTALFLAEIAKRGIIGAVLSLDENHEPIDPRVIEAFGNNTSLKYKTSPHNSEDLRFVIKNTSNLLKKGRSKKGSDTGCICNTMFVKPNGKVHYCGCDNAPIIGDLHTGVSYENYQLVKKITCCNY